jgi:hypothetical protein
MLYVEDALAEIYTSMIEDELFTVVDPDPWAFNFVCNVTRYVTQDKPLSSEQAKIVLKLLDRVSPIFVMKNKMTESDVQALIANPKYRREPYKSANIPREVRFLGDNLVGFRFKLNEIIVEDIRKMQFHFPNRHSIYFNHAHRIWVVPVTSKTYQPVLAIIQKHRFSFDDAVAAFFARCKTSENDLSAFAHGDDLIAATIANNPLLAWWTHSILGGEVV